MLIYVNYLLDLKINIIISYIIGHDILYYIIINQFSRHSNDIVKSYDVSTEI